MKVTEWLQEKMIIIIVDIVHFVFIKWNVRADENDVDYDVITTE